MNDQVYANGRVAVMSSKLFQADKFSRIADCNNLEEAFKVLSESGYGSGAAVSDPYDYEKALQAETDVALALLKELCFDKHARTYFMSKYDYVNAKILMKSKYARIDATEYCFGSATYDPQKMLKDFNGDDYSAYNPNMAEACDKIDAEFASGNRSPQTVDYFLDKAMYRDMSNAAKKSKYSALKQIFTWQADTTNIMTSYRLSKGGVNDGEMSRWFIEGGKIPLDVILKLRESGENGNSVLPSEYKEFYELCNSKCDDLMRAESVQKERISQYVEDSKDLLSVQPVISYFMCKINEVDKVRRILVCVKNGVDKEKIKEILNNGK